MPGNGEFEERVKAIGDTANRSAEYGARRCRGLSMVSKSHLDGLGGVAGRVYTTPARMPEQENTACEKACREFGKNTSYSHR